ncbi:hypothetical protein A5819_002189 [Enterococcus sp. 7E2_DIV0204]|uniref:flavin reductase n=1 Tax=Enterococcus sp. 7E2_DIV0204 TaxID=1834188 RepID=UPI000A32C2FC|nr:MULTISPECIES: flavin reductase [unclassified Enterococcus]OTN89691.1 hypothetical protein A5819_002189 [Enterococcus sp. 7E2_DIV0204]OTP52149.1 hypothetical protein A5884_001350 [Enterococcus sp. 7D2_DIV0200]
MFKKVEKTSFYYGFPVVLMTTKDLETARDNITPISSTWTLGKSIVLGIGLHNKGFLNLKLGSEVTLNLADETLWKNIEQIAQVTGTKKIPEYKKQAGYSYCADKFGLGNFTKLAGQEVQTVRIKECPIQIEATVATISLREEFAIVEFTIKGIFIDEKILHDERYINVDLWHPLIYKFREYTTTTQGIGKNFRFQEFDSTI